MLKAWLVTIMALTVIMEARGQPELGKEMVAHVIMNRVERSGWSVEEVLFQPLQFAVWNDYDLRLRVLLCAAAGQFPDNPWCARIPWGVGSEEYWWEVYDLVEEVYNGDRREPAGLEGMLFFDAPAFWPDGLPAWMGSDCVAIADHTFCKGR